MVKDLIENFFLVFDFQTKVIALFHQKIDCYPYPLFLKDVYYNGRRLMGSQLMVSAAYWDQIL
jgi:hypothetical protein